MYKTDSKNSNTYSYSYDEDGSSCDHFCGKNRGDVGRSLEKEFSELICVKS